MKFPLYRLLILVSALFLSACGGDPEGSDASSNGVDSEVVEAMTQARENIDQFFTRWEARDEEFSGLIQVFLFTPAGDDGNDGEFLWTRPVNYDNGTFSAIVLDQPKRLTQFQKGETITYTLDDVSDWLYVEDGVGIGGYLIKVQRSRMSPDQRARLDAQYPFDFE